ncbi:MAG: alpha/beta hydrolase [Acetobacteraceae bacterium]
MSRDGVALFYQEAAGDGPPVLLVHGWSCNHSHFAPQFEHFAARGHRVVAVDLRGHGRSDRPEQEYTMLGFADDLAWLCGELGLVKPLVIGHSMGGIAAFELAGRFPHVPAAVALVDSSVAPASRAGFSNAFDLLGGSDYLPKVRDYIARNLFIASDDTARRDQIVEQMSSTAHHVMLSAMSSVRAYDPAPAAAGLIAPCLYIAANMVPLRSDPARLRDLIPHVHYGMTVGAGHFCQLEVPDQVNAMLDRFLAVTGTFRA